MAERKEDRRVRKTKSALRRGLTTLMREKPIQEIKVREIAELIDINRGTFYQYYRDVYDMLNQLEDELFDEFNEALDESKLPSGIERVEQGFMKIVSILQDNSDLAIVLLGENGDSAFVNKIKEMIRQKVVKDWMIAYGEEPGESFQYFYEFLVSGCIGMLQRWLENGAKESPEKMVQMIKDIFVNRIMALKEA